MTTRLLALLPLLLPSLAAATTWTCVRDFVAIPAQYYEAVGTCTPSGAYASTGGDALGTSATSSATAQALCGSTAQVLVDLMTSSSADASASGQAAVPVSAICGFDHANFKYVCSIPPGATGSTTALTEVTATIVPPKFRFRALCK